MTYDEHHAELREQKAKEQARRDQYICAVVSGMNPESYSVQEFAEEAITVADALIAEADKEKV